MAWGITIAYFCIEFPRHYQKLNVLINAAGAALLGPLGLLFVYFICDRAKHGFAWWPVQIQESALIKKDLDDSPEAVEARIKRLEDGLNNRKSEESDSCEVEQLRLTITHMKNLNASLASQLQSLRREQTKADLLWASMKIVYELIQDKDPTRELLDEQARLRAEYQRYMQDAMRGQQAVSNSSPLINQSMQSPLSAFGQVLGNRFGN